MQPLSIGRLALLYLVVASFLLLGLGTYFVAEIRQTSDQIQAQEQLAARKELTDALQTVVSHMNAIATGLARWEETKQQLSLPDYYPLWRDNRIRDVGLLPADVKSVALYDKQGHILQGINSPEPMPLSLPGTAPLTLFKREPGFGHLYLFIPVHADPSGQVLMGFLGLKFNLFKELTKARAYRYADLSSLRVDLPEQTSVPVENLVSHLLIQARANPELGQYQSLLQDNLIRLSIALLAVLILASWLLHIWLVRPLRKLSGEIDAIGDNGLPLLGDSSDKQTLHVLELDNVRRSFNDYRARLLDLHRDLEKNSRDFHDQARHDALTGAFNRRAFDEDWHATSVSAHAGDLALLLFDCDHFKAINDTYGHHVGDAVIRAIAHILQEALRAGDRLYRIGGDEFSTLIEASSNSQAEAVAERCLEHILTHDFRQYGLSEPVTISIGVAMSGASADEGETGEDNRIFLMALQKRADLAMYAAKRPGGRKIMFYSPEIGNVEYLVANRAINAIFQAIQDPHLIELDYQAVMSLSGLHCDYSEALARIRFEGERLLPNAIFPVVQDRHLDAEFDLAVIQAIRRDMSLNRLGPEHGVSINISAPGIVNAKVIHALLALLESRQTRKIVVEITETALITQMETASQNISQLREAGALLALDDFGSGYSSLRYLTSMPVDIVKFDISMVQLLAQGNARQRAMIQEIAALVRAADYLIVAEGVENATLLEMVTRIGFTHAQGFHFGMPGEPAASDSNAQR